MGYAHVLRNIITHLQEQGFRQQALPFNSTPRRMCLWAVTARGAYLISVDSLTTISDLSSAWSNSMTSLSTIVLLITTNLHRAMVPVLKPDIYHNIVEILRSRIPADPHLLAPPHETLRAQKALVSLTKCSQVSPINWLGPYGGTDTLDPL